MHNTKIRLTACLATTAHEICASGMLFTEIEKKSVHTHTHTQHATIMQVIPACSEREREREREGASIPPIIMTEVSPLVSDYYALDEPTLHDSYSTII